MKYSSFWTWLIPEAKLYSDFSALFLLKQNWIVLLVVVDRFVLSCASKIIQSAVPEDAGLEKLEHLQREWIPEKREQLPTTVKSNAFDRTATEKSRYKGTIDPVTGVHSGTAWILQASKNLCTELPPDSCARYPLFNLPDTRLPFCMLYSSLGGWPSWTTSVAASFVLWSDWELLAGDRGKKIEYVVSFFLSLYDDLSLRLS